MDGTDGQGWLPELVAAYPANKGAASATLTWFNKLLRDADPETRSTVLCWAARYNEAVRAGGIRLADVQYLGAALKARAWESEPAAATWPPTDRPIPLRQALFTEGGALRCWTPEEARAAGFTGASR